MDDLLINERLTIPGEELRIAFARSGGPGGQNVNKVSSKVELRWAPGASAALTEDDRAWLLDKLASRITADGDLVVTSDKTRDQPKNRADALAKMAALIDRALVRPKKRRPTKRSRASHERRLTEKKRRGEVKASRAGSADS